MAGGSGERLGGRDKSSIRLGDSSLLDLARAAVSDAEQIVVVGPEVQGGPVAAIASGLRSVSTTQVVTLAVDQPFVGAAIPALRAAVEGHDVAVLVREGHRQYLASAWQRASLEAAITRLESPVNVSMRQLFAAVDVAEVPDIGGWSFDVDTPADLERARQLLEAQQER